MNMLKMCLNWKVIAALTTVAVGVYLAAPGAFAAALPLLILAICPLSMILMMKMMSGDNAEQHSGEQQDRQSTSSPQAATADELNAELQRLRARETAVADQLDALRRDERDQLQAPPGPRSS